MLRRSVIAVVLDVIEGLLGEKIEVPVGVHVDKAVPLSHVEVFVGIGAPYQIGLLGRACLLEEHDAAGCLLDEQIQIAVVVDVDPLGPGNVQAAEERVVVRRTSVVDHLEGVDIAHEQGEKARRGGSPRRTTSRPRGVGTASHQQEHRSARQPSHAIASQRKEAQGSQLAVRMATPAG